MFVSSCLPVAYSGSVIWQVVVADGASEVEVLEVEYLLLALDFGEILFLLAGFGPLQAALLEMFEPGGDGRALDRPQGVTAVLWGPREQEVNSTPPSPGHLQAKHTTSPGRFRGSDVPAFCLEGREAPGSHGRSDQTFRPPTLVRNQLSADMKTNIL